MQTPVALALLTAVNVQKVEVILSLSGIGLKTPLIECLWPRVTFECNGKIRTEPFTYWRELSQIKTKRHAILHAPGLPFHSSAKAIAGRHTLAEVVFLAAGLRPVKRPMLIADAAELIANKIHRHVQQKLAMATQKTSFKRRHQIALRKLERAEGKKKIRELILSMDIRMEKRDVVEAWQEAVVQRVMEV